MRGGSFSLCEDQESSGSNSFSLNSGQQQQQHWNNCSYGDSPDCWSPRLSSKEESLMKRRECDHQHSGGIGHGRLATTSSGIKVSIGNNEYLLKPALTEATLLLILKNFFEVILHLPVVNRWFLEVVRMYQLLQLLIKVLAGCDNELAKLHTSHPEACDKDGGVINMHIDDL
ncbi:uncharacterized protein LOC131612968 [Vicia villosa]|uniref:uncharacterized protein LOC131612968 n=1 Tax=Vicia villosa TaxID=3911 RepID=UPI00273B1DD6|nr:uncharacterized protein LOC131612968 [Vicia villosa]XP_058740684.1 uncharacterized protein LOC131612968 [Vicia villosa]